MKLPVEIAERRIAPSETPSLRAWISLTKELTARGLVRPDIGHVFGRDITWLLGSS